MDGSEMMKVSRWFRYLSMPLAAAAVFAVGCADQGSAPLVGPNAPEFAKSSGRGNSGEGKGKTENRGKGENGKKARGRTVTGTAADGTQESWVLATGVLPNLEGKKAEMVIGRAGGTLVLDGHVLVVPRGAVDEPTTFKMQPYTG